MEKRPCTTLNGDVAKRGGRRQAAGVQPAVQSDRHRLWFCCCLPQTRARFAMGALLPLAPAAQSAAGRSPTSFSGKPGAPPPARRGALPGT